MDQDKKSGAKTLLVSIIMNLPGPLVVGLGLLAGQSSTQIADFVRRSAELLAIIMSFIIYLIVAKHDNYDDIKKHKLESYSNIFVGSMMFLAGIIMIILALTMNNEDKGNVIPGIAIALLGAIANGIFWIKYTRLNKSEPNRILAVQSRLYRAKTLIDTSVLIALVSVLIAPQSRVSYWLDFIGSIIVAIYLLWCGIQTIYEAAKKKQD